MSARANVRPAPGGVWMVTVRGADEREQEYECASEEQAHTLARLFESGTRAMPMPRRTPRAEPSGPKGKLEELSRAARKLLLGKDEEAPEAPRPTRQRIEIEIPRFQVCRQSGLAAPSLLAATRRFGR